MVNCGFIFEAVVVRIDAPSLNLDDPSNINANFTFNQDIFRVTPSRINVTAFLPDNKDYHFEADTEELAIQMSVCPLLITVTYNGNTVAMAKMSWPERIANRVSETMGQVTHYARCDLMEAEGEPEPLYKPRQSVGQDRESRLKFYEKEMMDLCSRGPQLTTKIGTIEFIVRFQSKCQEMHEDYFKTNEDLRTQLDKLINPHDVLFIIGNSSDSRDELDVECENMFPLPSTMDDQRQNACENVSVPTALDLSPFRRMHGRRVQKMEILNMLRDCMLKMNNDFILNIKNLKIRWRNAQTVANQNRKKKKFARPSRLVTENVLNFGRIWIISHRF